MATLFPLLLIGLACVGIMYGCNLFEPAADHLGRNMQNGVKGATINAVGSSLPELFTTFILLFMYPDMDGFSGGVATTAGSAVFNAVLIPACAIIAVTMWARTVDSIEVSRRVLLRDGFFVLVAEIVLIVFLGQSTIFWWMGAILVGIYVLYFTTLMVGGWSSEDEDEDEDALCATGPLRRDIIKALKGDEVAMDTPRAWGFLLAGIAVVGVFCFALSEATVQLARLWEVPLFLTTVIFAAAATSVPDTILSIKDALKGNYDDAVANAIGSNIFDVCVSLGLPITIYCLVQGPIDLSATADDGVRMVRWVMLGFTLAVLGLLLPGKVGKKSGITLFFLYGGWVIYIAYRTVAT
jgi:cation:H+ antiporter